MTWFQRMLAKLRGERPALIDVPAPAPVHAMDALCQQYDATYIRDVFDGEVQLTLIRNDATLTARGPNTADALDALCVGRRYGPANACGSVSRGRYAVQAHISAIPHSRHDYVQHQPDDHGAWDLLGID